MTTMIIYDRDMELQDNPAVINLVMRLAIMKPMAVLVADGAQSPYCRAEEKTGAEGRRSYVCTRTRGHTAMHIAAADGAICLAWED